MVLPDFIRRLLKRERRQHKRGGRQRLRLEFRGLRVRTVDWSLGGCLLPALDPPLQPRVRVGDTFEGRISGIGLGNTGDFSADVVRITEDGEIGLRWLELDSHVFLALSSLRAKK